MSIIVKNSDLVSAASYKLPSAETIPEIEKLLSDGANINYSVFPILYRKIERIKADVKKVLNNPEVYADFLSRIHNDMDIIKYLLEHGAKTYAIYGESYLDITMSMILACNRSENNKDSTVPIILELIQILIRYGGRIVNISKFLMVYKLLPLEIVANIASRLKSTPNEIFRYIMEREKPKLLRMRHGYYYSDTLVRFQ